MKLGVAVFSLSIFAALSAEAKIFQNSYVSFEVPDNWTCLQEGVAWTCTPTSVVEAKEAVIVLAAKVAGPEDNITNFKNYLGQPKKITTKVGTPMPSQVVYSRERVLANTQWVQAQHLGSEIQDYYTLYLATIKDQLAILISFSSEKNRYQIYNPIFDKAIKSLKVTANKEMLFSKKQNRERGCHRHQCPRRRIRKLAPSTPASVAWFELDLFVRPYRTPGRGSWSLCVHHSRQT